jgi:hypothetical protein
MNLKFPTRGRILIRAFFLSAFIYFAFPENVAGRNYSISTTKEAGSDSLVEKGKFKDGLKHGKWTVYKNGKRLRIEKYKKGTLISFIQFNDRGKVVRTMDKKGRVRSFEPCDCPF